MLYVYSNSGVALYMLLMLYFEKSAHAVQSIACQHLCVDSNDARSMAAIDVLAGKLVSKKTGRFCYKLFEARGPAERTGLHASC